MPEAPDRLGALVYLLRGLPRTGDVLYVGAHPDDEENGLLALLTHHYGVRALYWSATRGEGGQSRVAPYTGVEFGVYRTWESLAAREIDGADSLFGPFFDYDFSKNGAEALQKWGEERLVRELVRAIRVVQPQLVISRWRGDASDGHGHHTAVGIAVKEAFFAAGDPARFAELEQVGLAAWQPRKLYQSTMGDWQRGRGRRGRSPAPRPRAGRLPAAEHRGLRSDRPAHVPGAGRARPERASDPGLRQRADSRRLLRLSAACGGRAGVRPERCDRALRGPRPLPRGSRRLSR